jgi:hypothetical protein
MRDSVGWSNEIKLESWSTFGTAWNGQTGRSRGGGSHDQAKGVGATIIVAAGQVGWMKRLKQRMPQHFLVIANGIVTHVDCW